MNNLNIVLCHTNVGYLKSLHSDLEKEGFNSVKPVKKPSTAFNHILRHKPDIAIIDGELDHAIIVDMVGTILEKNIHTKFILLFSRCRKEIRSITKTLNLKGALCVTDTIHDVIYCIKSVLKNIEYFSTKIEDYFESMQDERYTQLESLTSLELKTLSLLGPYRETVKIAKVLNLQPDKIEHQLQSIRLKFNEKQRRDCLTRWASKNNKLITSLAIHKDQNNQIMSVD